jgi:hypothetical protein
MTTRSSRKEKDSRKEALSTSSDDVEEGNVAVSNGYSAKDWEDFLNLYFVEDDINFDDGLDSDGWEEQECHPLNLSSDSDVKYSDVFSDTNEHHSLSPLPFLARTFGDLALIHNEGEAEHLSGRVVSAPKMEPNSPQTDGDDDFSHKSLVNENTKREKSEDNSEKCHATLHDFNTLNPLKQNHRKKSVERWLEKRQHRHWFRHDPHHGARRRAAAERQRVKGRFQKLATMNDSPGCSVLQHNSSTRGG